jgi:cytosine deaminase
MHSMEDVHANRIIALMAEARVSAIANPPINLTIQGRGDGYPKRRGMTRVPEMLGAGIDVAFGQDCVLDPWYSLGSADMLEVAHMGIHVAQMTSPGAMHQAFIAVTETAAKIMGLDGYGVARGCHADFVLLDAPNTVEALRLKANRLAVVRRGRVIARSAPMVSELSIEGRPASVDYRLPS